MDIPLEEDFNRKRTIIVDLDGTLCNAQHRQHLAGAGAWDEFHAACTEDTPFPDVEQFIFATKPMFNIVLLTARPEKFRAVTEAWLRGWMVEYDGLIMKPEGDYQKTIDFKLNALEALYDSKQGVLTNVCFALEDDDRNIEAFRNYGLPTWQVRPQGY